MPKKRPRPSGKSTIQTKISDRKARRKEERKSKKKKPRTQQNHEQSEDLKDWTEVWEPQLNYEKGKEDKKDQTKNNGTKSVESIKKSKSTKKRKAKTQTQMKSSTGDIFDMLDADTAAQVRKDDEEIAMLEKKLGLHKGSKDKKKLNKEYAKLEGYGDDFGDFLDGLDNMLDNIAGEGEYGDNMENLEYDSDESDPAVARAKHLLRQEQLKGDRSYDSIEVDSDDDESEHEEMVPMKGPPNDDSSRDEDESDASSDSYDSNDNGDGDSSEEEEAQGENDSSDDSDSESDSESDEDIDQKIAEDHDLKDTYRPVIGQDLYGNTIDEDKDQCEKPAKYVPPHLRKKQAAVENSNQLQTDDDSPERKEKLRAIQRLLNNNLNRLSDNTLESVAKSIAFIYDSPEYSIRDINEKMVKNMCAACVPPHMIMSSLIPVYIACISGIHFQTKDSVQLAGYVIEHVIIELWQQLKEKRENTSASSALILDDADPIHSNKEASNLMLIICYLYNYNAVHCTLVYDIVRQLIKSFAEIDVELLLLILSHCGSQLRSDDPTALKDIVLLVQERSMEIIKMHKGGQGKDDSVVTSSRAQFMISAITDLKNNKRRSADIALADKTSHYRRVIGRMKSASTGRGDALRLTVKDILDIETRGRWWVVGATWVQNQPRDQDDNAQTTDESERHIGSSDQSKGNSSTKVDVKMKRLLKLAAKQRMNTDLRRNVFCIIMGSDDCQDAFQKLIRGGLLKGKSEREVVRVLVHCCGQEKVYNPYYAHLANAVCDHQGKCKFTFQLTLWDAYKQFDDMKARKAANLAKLLAHLMTNNQLNLNVLKPIDISPDEMSEAAIIFLTILFSNLLEAYEDTDGVVQLFQRGEPSKEYLLRKAAENIDNDDAFSDNGRQSLKDSISIFLIHYLQQSPLTKKPTFRKNLKAAIKACEENNLDFMM